MTHTRPFLVTGLAVFLTLATHCLAQTSTGDYQVKSRGEHHRVWQRVVATTQPDGQTRYQTNAYTELADHLCYWDAEAGQWADTLELIEIANGYGVARHGAHQVVFAPNINTYGAVEIFMPESRGRNSQVPKPFRLHPLGLAYTDSATGDSVLIAEVKDSIGEVSGNQVTYHDCFSDGLVGSIQYVYTRSGVEQNIILESIPPDPVVYELNPETTRLEVFTEMAEAPEPVKTYNVLRQETNPFVRRQLAEPDLVDEVLTFGTMTMPTGSAFPLNSQLEEEKVPTAKSLEVREGRTVLVEKVDYRAIRPHLEGLPQANVGKQGKEELLARVAHPKGKQGAAKLIPSSPVRQARNKEEAKPIQTAWRKGPERGYVLDYSLINASALTNYTFQGNETYFINGIVNLYGLTTLEGGTVIKYTNNAASPRLSIYGGVDCQTSAYRPATFTAKDDDTVGQSISGSTGSPTSYYASYAMLLMVQGTNYSFHDLSIRHALYGIDSLYSATAFELKDSQIGKGTYGLYFASNCVVGNVLFYDLQRALYPASTGKGRGEHLTVHRTPYLFYNNTYGTNFHLTNCLLISVTNNIAFGRACNVVTNLDDTGVFQTVLGGQRYLADNSPYRDCGATNINADLCKGLRTRTTYPPLYLTNAITIDTVLAPQVQRDTDTPDLGYHYPAIDYLVACSVSNATLVVTNGASLAAFTMNSSGISLNNNASLISEGSALNPNHFTSHSVLQEAPTNGMFRTDSLVTGGSRTGAPPQVCCRFTCFDLPGAGRYHLYASYDDDHGFTNLVFRDCQFSGGQIKLCEKTLGTYGFTNNLFTRLVLDVEDAVKANWFNNLFRGVSGSFSAPHRTVGWSFKDNLLDSCTLSNCLPNLTNNYNAYFQSSSFYSTYGTNLYDKVLTNLAYQAGPLGPYYYATGQTGLIDVGSRNATNAGLYHFTTTTNQVKEGTSQVDIGFHYVAVDANGYLLDYDSDGLPDYVEDSNGNGLPDSGETNWTEPNSLYGLGSTLKLQVFTPLK